MINHVRTLLLNREGELVPAGAHLAEEYVPVYSPLVLGTQLQWVYDTLYGSDPDYEGKLYSTAEYMAILHSTEFVSYVTALDSRITYDVAVSGLIDQEYGLAVTTESTSVLTVLGTWKEPAYKGRMRNDWVVTAATANQVTVRHVQTGSTVVQVLVFDADGASNRFSLLESDFDAIIVDNGGIAGDRWDIRHREPIDGDLGDVLGELQQMSGSVERALFGTSTAEPYATFRHLFQDHKALPFRLSGTLLALAYRMEAMRNP